MEFDDVQKSLEQEIQVLSPRLDEVALLYMVQMIIDLGVDWRVNSVFSQASIRDQLPSKHHLKFDRIIMHLADRKMLSRDRVGDDCHIVEPRPSEDPVQLLKVLREQSPGTEIDLVARCGPRLAEVLRGDVEALSLLFPQGSTQEAADFYTNSSLFRHYNELAAQVIGRAAESLPAGQKLRVLEVGAGTGGLTDRILKGLPPEQTEYVFTDMSTLFLTAAKRRFADFSGLETAIFDVTKPADQQGFELGSFDIVLAANVIHATPQLRKTLANVHNLLRENGWLVMLEGTHPPLWGDMVFALIDGWWIFEDKDIRPDYPLMPPDRWHSVLKETGFRQVEHFAHSSPDGAQAALHTLFVVGAGHADRANSRPVSQPTRSVVAPPQQQTIAQSSATDLPFDPDERRLEVESHLMSHVVRITQLPESSINRSRSLFDLGMDSLMAIDLRTSIERDFGVELPMPVLLKQPCVDDITNFVNERLAFEQIDNRGDSSSKDKYHNESHIGSDTLVRMQPDGKHKPLFFVPAGYGDLLAFHDIAQQLGDDQPVYGLQPPAATRLPSVKDFSIYRLVSMYVEEIKKVQPTGPYRLCGYSAGGIIVIELARELLRFCDEVDLLVAFDPPPKVPLWLDVVYSIFKSFSQHTGLISLTKRLKYGWMERMFHAVRDAGMRTHTAVTREHRLEPYPKQLTYFRARRSFIPWMSLAATLTRTETFWRRIAAGGIEVHWVPGTHYNMLRHENASVLAAELRDCLTRCNRVLIDGKRNSEHS